MDKNALSITLNSKISSPKDSDYEVILSWFKSMEDIITWAGPSVGNLKQRKLILEKLKQSGYLSHSLELTNAELHPRERLVGFGQYQQIAGTVHLARLVINPAYRKNGFLKFLIYKLVQRAELNSKVNRLTLFVYRDNQPAYLAYEKFGFTKQEPPPGVVLPEGCDFMMLAKQKLQYLFRN